MKGLIFIFTGILLLSTIAFAQGAHGNTMPPMQGKMLPPGGGGMGMMPPGMNGAMENAPAVLFDISELNKLMNDIGLAKPVAAKITGIARNFISTFNEKIIRIQKEELTVREELLKDKPDMQIILSSITKKTQSFAEIEFAQIKRDMEIKALLSQDEFDNWKSEMMKRMRQMMPSRMEKNADCPMPKK